MARRFEVEDELQAMLDWADAIGRPPEDGPIGPDDEGRIVFREGNHTGSPVGDWPLHLAWITNARRFQEGDWRWRYPDSTRTWAQRWLRVRASGRARQSPKSFHAADWVLDSCIASERRRGM